MLLAGPGAEVVVFAALGAKRPVGVGRGIQTVPAASRASDGARFHPGAVLGPSARVNALLAGSDAQGHFESDVLVACLHATGLIGLHHAHPNHQAVAADFWNKTKAWFNRHTHQHKSSLRE